jgi:hypothetical protein
MAYKGASQEHEITLSAPYPLLLTTKSYPEDESASCQEEDEPRKKLAGSLPFPCPLESISLQAPIPEARPEKQE